MILREKLKAQPLSLIGHLGNIFGCELCIVVNCELQ